VENFLDRKYATGGRNLTIAKAATQRTLIIETSGHWFTTWVCSVCNADWVAPVPPMHSNTSFWTSNMVSIESYWFLRCCYHYDSGRNYCLLCQNQLLFFKGALGLQPRQLV